MAGEPIARATESRSAPAWLVVKHDETVANCRIFYENGHFAWECCDGWNSVISDLSYAIEALNLEYYGKYRVKCVAEQIKEKFGTLRVYTRTTIDPPVWKAFIVSCVRALYQAVLRIKVDHKMQKVFDSRAHIKYEYEQLTEKEFAEKTSSNRVSCANMKFFGSDGRFYSVSAINVPAKIHMEPTRYVFLHRVRSLFERILYSVSTWADTSVHTPEQRVMVVNLSNTVEKLAVEAERECYSKCELCGSQIGTEYSPRCVTKGWISYICEKCAKSNNMKYSKDNGDNESKN